MNTICVAFYILWMLQCAGNFPVLYPRYQMLSILTTYKHTVLKEFESHKQHIKRCDATE